MAKSMKAFVYQGVGKPSEIREIPVPVPAEGELLLKVEACGICGSDLHAAEAGFALPGSVMGHEYVGRLVAKGAGVSGDWKEDDLVLGIGGKPCRSCPACMRREYIKCPKFIIQGYDPQVPGGYAEYTTCLADLSLRVPGGLSSTDAAAVEPLSVGLAGWKAANVVPGGSILVMGAGVIGMTVLQWARFFGAIDAGGNVSSRASSIPPVRLERAKLNGATVVIDGTKDSNPVRAMQEKTGRTPSYIFECIGKPILQEIINIASPNTHIVVLGGSMIPEQISSLSAVMKNLRMSFSFAYEIPGDLEFTLQMMVRRRISADSLITAKIGLDELPAMFENLGKPNEHCKVLVMP